jgi:hypothetical protein
VSPPSRLGGAYRGNGLTPPLRPSPKATRNTSGML